MAELIGLIARWVHVSSAIGHVGGAGLLVLAGPSDRPTALRWESWALAGCHALVLAALLSGLVTVAAQTAVLEGRARAAVEPAAVARMLVRTQGGNIWLVRSGLLVLLGAFLALRGNIRDRADWRAARRANGRACCWTTSRMTSCWSLMSRTSRFRRWARCSTATAPGS